MKTGEHSIPRNSQEQQPESAVDIGLATSDEGLDMALAMVSPQGHSLLVQYVRSGQFGLRYNTDELDFIYGKISANTLYYTLGWYGCHDFEELYNLEAFAEVAYSNHFSPNLHEYTTAMAWFARGALDTSTEDGALAAAVAVAKAGHQAMQEDDLEALRQLGSLDLQRDFEIDTGSCYGLLAAAVFEAANGCYQDAHRYCIYASFQTEDDIDDAPLSMISDMMVWTAAKNDED